MKSPKQSSPFFAAGKMFTVRTSSDILSKLARNRNKKRRKYIKIRDVKVRVANKATSVTENALKTVL